MIREHLFLSLDLFHCWTFVFNFSVQVLSLNLHRFNFCLVFFHIYFLSLLHFFVHALLSWPHWETLLPLFWTLYSINHVALAHHTAISPWLRLVLVSGPSDLQARSPWPCCGRLSPSDPDTGAPVSPCPNLGLMTCLHSELPRSSPWTLTTRSLHPY